MEQLNFGTASPSSPGNSHDHQNSSPLEQYKKYEHNKTTNDTLASEKKKKKKEDQKQIENMLL